MILVLFRIPEFFTQKTYPAKYNSRSDELYTVF